jgi:hypothetical protein
MKNRLFAFTIVMLMLVGPITADSQTTVQQLLEKYYFIQKNLAGDSIAGVSTAAAEIEKRGMQAAKADLKNKAALTAVSLAAAKLKSGDLKSVRNGFGELSEKMIVFFKASGSKWSPPYQVYCPMVKKNWLQPNKEIRNPYYGSEMPTCGELVNP